MPLAPNSTTLSITRVYCPTHHGRRCQLRISQGEVVSHEEVLPEVSDIQEFTLYSHNGEAVSREGVLPEAPMLPDVVSDIQEFTLVLIRKLEAVFGHELKIESQVGKLHEELAEFEEDHELAELADIVVVACTAANVLGYSAEELITEVWAKTYRNSQREWAATGLIARHISGE